MPGPAGGPSGVLCPLDASPSDILATSTWAVRVPRRLQELRLLIMAAQNELTESEPLPDQTILIRHFHGNQSQAEVARQIGASQMHVSRLIARSLRRLRHALDPDNS